MGADSSSRPWRSRRSAITDEVIKKVASPHFDKVSEVRINPTISPQWHFVIHVWLKHRVFIFEVHHIVGCKYLVLMNPPTDDVHVNNARSWQAAIVATSQQLKKALGIPVISDSRHRRQ